MDTENEEVEDKLDIRIEDILVSTSKALQLAEFSNDMQCTVAVFHTSIKYGDSPYIDREFVQDKNIALLLVRFRKSEENNVKTFSVDPHVVLAYQEGDKVNVFVSASPLVMPERLKKAKSVTIQYFARNYPGWKIDWSMKDRCTVVKDENVYYNPNAHSFQWDKKRNGKDKDNKRSSK